MIRRLASASFFVALVSAAHAQTGANDVSEPTAETEEETVGEDLDAFVETAIRGGLLVPADGDGSEPAITADGGTVRYASAECAGPYPLDFSVVRSLRKFTELPDAIDADDTVSADDKLRKDLKSKLALGLYAEAKALLTFADDEQWEPYRKFIELMENRQQPDLAYLGELSSCFPEANLWQAAAELVMFEPGGVERIANEIASIRTLPFNLREDTAMLIVPSLVIERRSDLAQQVIATFTPEEIENSTRLSALKTAIIDMPNGSESDDRLVMLMSRPKLKLAALLILVERNEQLRPTVRSFVLEEAWNMLETNETQHNLDPILEFVIDHLASGDLYDGLQRILDLPVAGREEVRASIDSYTVKALDDYLTDDDPANALNALYTLTRFHSDLPVDGYGTALRKQGAVKALELGLFSMVKEFLGPVERNPEIANLLAEAAFWGHVDQDLFDVREDFPTEAEINRMAGIRALQANLPNIATAAYTSLSAYPSKQLELIEQGAIVDNWALWDLNFPKLVNGLTDAEVVRLDRVRTIKVSKGISPDGAGREIRPYQIADLLDSSRKKLAVPQAGASQ
ncbi:MAG: hypothetical protein HRT80_05665 [Henriciella sp.]|nr:hypothetical protein [Henriciella sp.]